VGGAPELIRDGETGVLVPAHDSPGLARGMLQVMELDAAERQRMGDAARQHAEMNFDIERVIAEWESLLSELLPRISVPDVRPLTP
jgi:glycosyltransferase involved in cell wall biosynthesis